MKKKIHGPHGRSRRDNFGRLIDSFPLQEKLLGLTHITSSYMLREVLQAKAITAQEECPSLEENVTYAFYGRAAFRQTHDDQPTSLTSLLPVVLILDPRNTPAPRYIFPFDSGAFIEGLLDDYLAPYMPLVDFMLAPDAASAAKLVQKMFGTNSNFLKNLPGNHSSEGSQFELESYLKIVYACTQSNTKKLDDRISTPEFVFESPIAIESSVCAAILPDTLTDDPETGARLKRLGIQVLEYSWSGGNRPGELHFVIRQLVEQIYQTRGWL